MCSHELILKGPSIYFRGSSGCKHYFVHDHFKGGGGGGGYCLFVDWRISGEWLVIRSVSVHSRLQFVVAWMGIALVLFSFAESGVVFRCLPERWATSTDRSGTSTDRVWQ